MKQSNKGEGTDSKRIGPRQEYRRTGKAPDAADAGGGKTTPDSYKKGGPVKGHKR